MENNPRRSRMRRTAKGKPLVLTERDIAIFRILSRYRFLRSTYLHAYVGGASVKRFKERLGDLFHEGYLSRPDTQWRYATSRHAPAVYELDKGALAVLADQQGGIEPSWAGLGTRAHRQYSHSLMVCEVLSSMELATRAQDDVRFVPWPEILAKAPEATLRVASPMVLPTIADEGRFIVPDGIFGLEYIQGNKRSYRFFALEADRGTMPVCRDTNAQSSILRKYRDYLDVLRHETYRSQLGLPNLLVLFVSDDNIRISAMKSALEPLQGSKAAILFKALAASSGSAQHCPQAHLFTDCWARAGLDALSIARANG